MSGYSREDFDIPVKDYDFSSMKDISSLIDQMSEAGGFTATKLAFARDILRSSISKTSSEGVLNWISFPACLCATGTRGFFLEALKSCLLYTSPSPRDVEESRMPSSA